MAQRIKSIGAIGTGSRRRSRLAICGSARICLNWTGSGSCCACPRGWRGRGTGIRTNIPADISRCTVISGAAARWGTMKSWTAALIFMRPQTFHDGRRRLLLGWMGMPDAEYANPTVKNGWQHCMTVPCELHNVGGRLVRTPAAELDGLHGRTLAPEEAEVFDLQCRVGGNGRILIRGCAALSGKTESSAPVPPGRLRGRQNGAQRGNGNGPAAADPGGHLLP